MNIIICGGRWVDSREPIHNYIDYLVERYGSELTIITGGATGADTIAFEYAVGLGVNCAVYEADWTKCGPDCPPVHMKQNKRGDMYCPTAGLRRNKQMLEHPAHGVAAFIDRPLEQSTGTNHMVDIALEADVPVRIIQVPRQANGEHQVFEAPELREGEQLLHVKLDFATFGLVVRDGVVTYTAPIAKYAKGWTCDRARTYFSGKRGGEVTLIDHTGELVSA